MTIDIEALEAMALDTENATAFIPVPEGSYPAYIEAYKLKVITVQDEDRVILSITWTITDVEIAETMNIEEPKVRQDIWLDVTQDGSISFGQNKNVQFGKFRAAIGKNNPEQSFHFSQLLGCSAQVSVTHNPDKDDPSIIYANVNGVSPLY